MDIHTLFMVFAIPNSEFVGKVKIYVKTKTVQLTSRHTVDEVSPEAPLLPLLAHHRTHAISSLYGVVRFFCCVPSFVANEDNTH